LRKPLGVKDVMTAFFARNAATTNEAYRSDLLRLAEWLTEQGHLPEDFIVLDEQGNRLAAWIFETGPAHMNALLMQWVADSKARSAPLTINRRLAAIRSLVKLGRTLGVINWTLDVQGVKGARGVKDMRGPVPVDVKKLFAAATSDREQAMLFLLYTRGLRSVEVRELRVKHVLLERSEVLVRGKGKTGLAPITVSPRTTDALRKLVKGRKPEHFVFAPRYGDVPVSQMNVWRTVKAIGARCGVLVRPHGLRHSAITAVLDATNGDVRRTQKFSRHANANVLLTHYDDARQDFGGQLTKVLDEEMP
jgi:integrase/recombinase XerC